MDYIFKGCRSWGGDYELQIIGYRGQVMGYGLWGIRATRVSDYL
jgi:hypothetical protein